MKKKGLVLILVLLFCLFLSGIGHKESKVSAADGEKYKLVTNVADLAVGDKIVIVCQSKIKGMGTVSENGASVDISLSEDKTLATLNTSVVKLTVESGYSTGTYSFKTSDNKYLYWSSSNTLKLNATKSDNSSWNININSAGVATISNCNDSSRKLQYNATNPRFACYTSSQTDVNIYKEQSTFAQIKSLLDTYYNAGSYTKDTIINVQPELENEIKEYFHTGNMPELKRTTVYTPGKLVMTTEKDKNGVGYKDDGNNMVRFYGKEETFDFSVSNTSVEKYYVTLKDFVDGTTGQTCNYGELDITKGWTVSSDGERTIYTSTDAGVKEAFKLFTAPMWLGGLDDKGDNYLDFTKTTIEVVDHELVMKLWVAETEMPENGVGGKLVATAEVDSEGANAVFSQATIYYPYAKEVDRVVQELELWNNKEVTEEVTLPQKDTKDLFEFIWKLDGEVIKTIGHEPGGNDEEYNLTVTYSAKGVEDSSLPITIKVPKKQASVATDTLSIFANKGTLSGESITWKSNNFTFTNNKGGATSDIRTSDADHFRAYKNSNIIISSTNGQKIKSIVITCTSGTYANDLKNSTFSTGTTSVSEKNVTITFSTPVDSVTITLGVNQVRLNKVVVNFEQ